VLRQPDSCYTKLKVSEGYHNFSPIQLRYICILQRFVPLTTGMRWLFLGAHFDNEVSIVADAAR
jgi:hypothetical protein